MRSADRGDPAGRPRRGSRSLCSTRSRPRRRGRPWPGDARALAPGSSLTGRRLDVLFDAQLASRHLDLAARWLRAQGRASTRSARPATRATRRSPPPCDRPTRRCCTTAPAASTWPAPSRCRATTASRDVLLGLLAAADEPIAGGRHKVFGHHDLAVIPQTSTIASHLPRALGVAFAIGRAAPPRACRSRWPADAVAVCSFGDASAQPLDGARARSTPPRATAHQGLPLPLLFVCEDNGLGISVPTPRGLDRRRRWPGRGLRYVHADGTDPVAVLDAAERARRAGPRAAAAGVPAPAHRALGGHAGTDVEAAYRDAGRDRGPTTSATRCSATARLLVGAGLATPDELVRRGYDDARAPVRAQAAAG